MLRQKTFGVGLSIVTTCAYSIESGETTISPDHSFENRYRRKTMKKLLKHRFLALSLALGLASLIAGVSVSAACPPIRIIRLGGRYLVCELAGSSTSPDGYSVCSYVCN